MGSVTYRVKWSFGLFQRINLVLMGHSIHVYMFYTHPQRFMHCHTSFITFVAKCTFCVALGEVLCITVALMKSCFYLIFQGINVVSSIIWVCHHDIVLSLFTWASLIPRLALSKKFHSWETWLHLAFMNWKLRSLNPQALTFPLRTMHYVVTVPNLDPWASEQHNFFP